MNQNTVCKTSFIEIQNDLDNTFHSEMKKDIRAGLTAQQKFIPSKYFYDARGSRLFEEICCLTEYYPTRTEISILKDTVHEIMGSFEQGDLVELGSGSNWKIKMLLDAAGKARIPYLRYVPVDVSKTAMFESSRELLEIYPALTVLGIVADFTRHTYAIPSGCPRIILFFGSTIGNLNEADRLNFLRFVAGSMRAEDRFFIGLDLIKSKKILESAYNDSQGVTSEFNKNILSVLNRELDAGFNLSHFDHRAFFNETEEQVEMHLRANRRISAEIDALGLNVALEKDETIHTEICRKFSREKAEHMAFEAGLAVTQWFSDPKEWFALAELRLKDF